MDCENVSLCYRCSGVAKQESGSLLGCSTSERRCADVRKSLSKDNIMYREYKTANYISC